MRSVEIQVKDAARRLGVNESRVRQLLHAGDLHGRRVGGSWLIAADDVARLERRRRQAGRPMGPMRAWGLLDLLSGGNAPWLSYSARSQVRSSMARLRDADADQWRSVLRGRSQVIRAQAHPAAHARLRAVEGVLPAGSAEAVRRGFDLVALDDGVPEIYVHADRWPGLATSLAIREADEPNLLVRLPKGLWPFSAGALPDAVIAADLLEAVEPRAARAGELRLGELLEASRR